MYDSPRRLDPVWTAPLLFVTLGLLFAALPIAKAVLRPNCENNKDYTLWYETALATRAGESLYAPQLHGEVKFMYPPPLAVLVFMPLSHLGDTGFVAVLATLSAFAWAFSVFASITLVMGKWPGHPRWVYIVPGLAVGSYVWDLQLLGQINLVLLALVLGSFLALRSRRTWIAGWLFGAAVAIKVFPLPAVALFIVRKQWAAVAWSAIAIAAWVWFIPGCLRGFELTTNELQTWAVLMVEDQSGGTMAGRSSIGFTRRNQSLVSLSHRLLRPIEAGDEVHAQVNLADVSPKTAQLIGYSVCFGLGLVLLIAARMKFATSPKAEGIEVAMVCALVPLCSPLAWTYFFCWLLPAWVAIACLWNEGSKRVARAGAFLAGILLLSAVSEQVDPRLQAAGVTAWGSVTLFLTLAYMRWKLPDSLAVSQQMPIRMAA